MSALDRELAVLRQLSAAWPDGLDAEQLVAGSSSALTWRRIRGLLADLDDRDLVAGRSVRRSAYDQVGDSPTEEPMRREYHITRHGRERLKKSDAIVALAEQRMTIGDRLISYGPSMGVYSALWVALIALDVASWWFVVLIALGVPIGRVMRRAVSSPWLRRRLVARDEADRRRVRSPR